MERIYLAGCSRHYGRVDFPRFCREQILLGKRWVEVWGAVPQLFIDHYGYDDAGRLRQALDEAGLVCRVFTPKAYRYNLGSDDERVRGWSLAYYKECLRAASLLGAEVMLVSLPAVIRDGDMELAKKVFLENMGELADFAAETGILLALGGCSGLAGDLPEFIGLMERLQLPQVGCFLETESLLDSSYSMKEWLGELGSRLVHIHFADASEAGSCKIGDGRLPVRRYLADILESGYQGGLSPFFTAFSCERDPFAVSLSHDDALKRLLKEVHGDA